MYLNPRLAVLVTFALVWSARAEVTLQEYPVPRGHGIHDVWADPAPNGPVYISAQRSGHLGILDPNSGKIESVALGRGSSPHGVTLDRAAAPVPTAGGPHGLV